MLGYGIGLAEQFFQKVLNGLWVFSHAHFQHEVCKCVVA